MLKDFFTWLLRAKGRTYVTIGGVKSSLCLFDIAIQQ